ncbi:hypothetical protein Pint_02157 [Pistacia integerrima]|uniref:Uncharacterized protein n=1 Tax=Pistacia integerrima TaxID=434235 RepID=A0ACC0ZJZ1_9ROSI|nr:hypothetical protein Pint_02157 [Pistacia integerrima]
MAVDEQKSSSGPEGKVWSLCKMPFWQSSNGSSSSSSSSSMHNNNVYQQNNSQQLGVRSTTHSPNVSTMAKSFLPTRRRLRLDPPNKLYFPYEPGKQVRSAISIKNTSRSHVAFKMSLFYLSLTLEIKNQDMAISLPTCLSLQFQTTAPKSCYMRPPGGILAPGESLIATVFKFVEPPENNERPVDQKSKVKFKIMSLKVKGEMDYVPELFDEQKDQVAVEQILRVIFLDPERPSPALDKLKRQLAEAEAALEARKKPPEDTGPRIVGEGLVIDEWVRHCTQWSLFYSTYTFSNIVFCSSLCQKERRERADISIKQSCILRPFVIGRMFKRLRGMLKKGSYPATCRYGILISMEIVDFGGSKVTLSFMIFYVADFLLNFGIFQPSHVPECRRFEHRK